MVKNLVYFYVCMFVCVYCIILMVLGFELRAFHLLGSVLYHVSHAPSPNLAYFKCGSRKIAHLSPDSCSRASHPLVLFNS
jgi:hypothetical protein